MKPLIIKNKTQLKIVRFLSRDLSNTNYTKNFTDYSKQNKKSQVAKILEFKNKKSEQHNTQTGRTRNYSPELSRFLTSDPLGLQGGDVNLYRYVKNNPMIYVDPEGKSLGKVIVGIGVFAATMYYVNKYLNVKPRVERGVQAGLKHAEKVRYDENKLPGAPTPIVTKIERLNIKYREQKAEREMKLHKEKEKMLSGCGNK